ncbi:Putative ABC-type transporter, substrate-binding lipoprotein [Corynebacterium glyciniphilum AJ 3170]|uniref:Putative ABC-type transporter, substrate-binding lipoprotein n=1 Tax=Corynebacterium glyciniphilum AJ 3170 TaxID=1404245 RepID=X5DTH5_9CORY|nr:ABC transporter substrate-binding protein [Corynebacterium glyciniphilum]AHW63967.1 Putative ABC-type transporter, substrate-binding lipoprotein [Corynebacterium glyciniphilum AJ 3170]
MTTTALPRVSRTAVALLATASLLLSTSACSGGDGHGTGASDAAMSLKLGWSEGWTAPQVAVAAEEGMWGDHDLDVTTTPFDSGRAALEALLGGGVDAAVLTEFPLVAAALRDQGVTAVANLSSYDSYRIIGSKKAGVRDDAGDADVGIASLYGKRVGVTLGTNMNFILDELLESNDIEAEIVNIGPTDFATALQKGDIDAGLMFDTFYAPTKKALGDDYVDIAVPPELYTGTMLLVVKNDLVEGGPDRLRALVDGVHDATGFIGGEPDAAREILTKRLVGGGATVDEETVRERWDEYDYTPGLDDSVRELMVREAEWIIDEGNGDAGPDIGTKIDGVLGIDAADTV